MNLKIFAISAPLALFLILTGCDGAQQGHEPGHGQQDPAVEVGYIELRPTLIDRTNQLPGRVVAYRVAEIRPQVSGIIQSRSFEQGSYVEAGQKLYQVDSARYAADYEMAQAGLQDAQARRDNANLVFNRFEKLLAERAISQQEYDDALSRLDQAEAAVGVAKAEVERAAVELDYTTIRSPISGYIGPSGVTEGALVTAQQEHALATVRQLDPVYVDLSQTAKESGLLGDRLLELEVGNTDTHGLAVVLYPGIDSTEYAHEGMLDVADLAVDPRTGAIRWRAVFPNPDRVLLPGAFVRASIEGIGRTREILVPQKAVRVVSGGEKRVWVVDAGGKARKRTIRTGAAYDNNWVVLDGLEVGERLIVEGTMNLRDGDPVKPEKIGDHHEKSARAESPDTPKPRLPPSDNPP